MRVTLIRHGATPGNALRRYIGVTDEPLSPAGEEQARTFPAFPCDAVFVTPLVRTQQTARILFPNAEQRVVADLREMDFGAFEGRSADEMASDPAYRAWVDGMCLGPCPGGESRAAFSHRACTAFQNVIAEAQARGMDEAVFVVHGGTIMAILEYFGRPKQDYYAYHAANCGGYRCVTADPCEPDDPAFVLAGIEPLEVKP